MGGSVAWCECKDIRRSGVAWLEDKWAVCPILSATPSFTGGSERRRIWLVLKMRKETIILDRFRGGEAR